MLNGSVARLIATRTWDAGFDFAAYVKAKEELARDQVAALRLLRENTAVVVDAIGAVSDADLAVNVETPFQTRTLAQIIAYPYWNMSYHEGQINYIASMLGCLS